MQFEINEHSIAIISEALGGSNVDNCPHACVARPCGTLAKCIPILENYVCECNPSNEQCNKAEEVSAEELNVEIALAHASSTENTNSYYSSSSASHATIDDEEGSTDTDDSDDDSDDYYFEYDEDEATSNNDDTEKILVRVEKSTTTTTSTTTKRPLTSSVGTTITKPTMETVAMMMMPRANPYKDLIEGIEAHYRLRGRYMSEQQQKIIDTKKKQKQQAKNDNRYISDLELNAHLDAVDDDAAAKEEEKANEYERHKAKHAMRYRPEDDTIIDEILIDEMDKIMKDVTVEMQTKSTNQIVHQGACFNGEDSYFHYSDAETMRRVISYQIDLNLRFKTHSKNGVILWTGRHSAKEDDDFLSLGIENG